LFRSEAEEVPRRFRGVRGERRVRGLLERSFEVVSPDEEDDRAKDQREELAVDEIGPAVDAPVRLAVLEGRLVLRDEVIVHDHLQEGEPEEEPDQEEEHRDRDVVRLGDDRAEVGVGEAQAVERRREDRDGADEPPARPPPAQEDHQGEADDRDDEEADGAESAIDGVLDELGHGSAFSSALYMGPEMPPSLRTRQKWTAMRTPAPSGIAMQWST